MYRLIITAANNKPNVLSPENSHRKISNPILTGLLFALNHKFFISSDKSNKGSVKKMLFAHAPIITLPADHPNIPEMRIAELTSILHLNRI
jgi:hypothetical protein